MEAVESVFVDAGVFPEPDRVRDALGDASWVWDAVCGVFDAVGATVTWRHYRDGGWLAKASQRRGTVAWIAVQPGALRVSFHFAERLRAALLADDGLSAPLKERVAQMPASGRLLSIPLDLRGDGDVADVERLVALKSLWR